MNKYVIRSARIEDLPELIELLADDELGRQRDPVAHPLPYFYINAFNAIAVDERNDIVVIEHDGRVIAMLQMTFIPGLTHQGGERAQIEGVRVASDYRTQGVGRFLIDQVIERAQERGCRMVQLTTDKRRPNAHRFYDSLGFEPSHEGMKLRL